MSINLTTREQEILDSLLAGKSPKEIAYTLSISYNTVLTYQKNLYKKLGVNSIQELFAKYSKTTENDKPLDLPVSEDESEVDFIQLAVIEDDAGSSIKIIRDFQKIQGRYIKTYTLIGELFPSKSSFVAINFTPDPPTLEKMKKMKSFSFMVLGDDNTYAACIGTVDARVEGENNGYHKLFDTKNGEITKIHIYIEELHQSPHYGKKVPFIHDNIKWLNLGVYSTNKFNLKIWDIRFNE